jgi:hypothetical protein
MNAGILAGRAAGAVVADATVRVSLLPRCPRHTGALPQVGPVYSFEMSAGDAPPENKYQSAQVSFQ